MKSESLTKLSPCKIPGSVTNEDVIVPGICAGLGANGTTLRNRISLAIELPLWPDMCRSKMIKLPEYFYSFASLLPNPAQIPNALFRLRSTPRVGILRDETAQIPCTIWSAFNTQNGYFA